ncbi:unnamed protein product [Brassica napus]|uniref:(rape) hypothetical protein n=1 Tax=Brassica napus TaxID=3708 RepID=A0A816KTK5_BRANA|nr:unnamed protein product [Brassica napus]
MIHNHLSCKYKVLQEWGFFFFAAIAKGISMCLDILFTCSNFLNVDSGLLQHDMANIQKKKEEEKVSSHFDTLACCSF